MAVHNFTIDGIVIMVNLPSFAEAVLADQVVSGDDWIKGFADMVAMKVSAVKRRIADGELQLAMSEGRADQLSATEDAVVQAVFDQPSYRNRVQRDADEVAKAAVEAAAEAQALAEATAAAAAANPADADLADIAAKAAAASAKAAARAAEAAMAAEQA